jgi:hypothetical protein
MILDVPEKPLWNRCHYLSQRPPSYTSFFLAQIHFGDELIIICNEQLASFQTPQTKTNKQALTGLCHLNTCM